MDYVFTNSETSVIFIYRWLTNFKNFSAQKFIYINLSSVQNHIYMQVCILHVHTIFNLIYAIVLVLILCTQVLKIEYTSVY